MANDKRLALHATLLAIPGVVAAYFQPPSSIRMTYPCIVYELDGITTKFADNTQYFFEKKYKLTVIDADPDSEIPNSVGNLPKCIFNRHFTNDGLNHDVYKIAY